MNSKKLSVTIPGSEWDQERREPLLPPTSPTSAGSSPSPRRSRARATVSGVFTNTLKSVFGTGVLAMPYAFAKVGIYPGLLATTAICLWSFYTCNLIAQCKTMVPRARTYDDIAEATLGRFGRVLGTVNMFLNQILVCVSYTIFCATNVTDVAGFHHDGMGYPHWLALAMLPCVAVFACLRDISLLAAVSALGNSLVMASLVTILIGAEPELKWRVWEVPPDWRLTSLASFFALTAMAFSGHSEVVPIFSSMKCKDKYGSVLRGVAATSLLSFAGIGALVFSAYGADTKPIVFQNLTSMPSMVARLAMSAVVYLTMPLKLFAAIVIVESRLLEDVDGDAEVEPQTPCSPSSLPEEFTSAEHRADPNPPAQVLVDSQSNLSSSAMNQSVTAVESPPAQVQWDAITAGCKYSRTQTVLVDSQSDLSSAAMIQFRLPVDGEEEEGEEDTVCPFVTESKQILIRVLLASLPICIALTGVHFAVLLEFVGSFCISTVAFALPPIMHLKLFWNVTVLGEPSFANACRKAFHVLLAILGVSATIFSSAHCLIAHT